MSDIPLKTVTVDEMASQVGELATEFDKSNANTRARQPYVTALESVEEELAGLLTLIDEEAVKETMSASLGFYLSKAPELRVQRQTILEGLKAWTVEALGLPNPPYISEAFLAKLGVPRERSHRFGSRPSPYPGSARKNTTPSWTDRGNRWGGRGNQSARRSSNDFEEESQDRNSHRRRARGITNRWL